MTTETQRWVIHLSGGWPVCVCWQQSEDGDGTMLCLGLNWRIGFRRQELASSFSYLYAWSLWFGPVTITRKAEWASFETWKDLHAAAFEREMSEGPDREEPDGYREL